MLLSLLFSLNASASINHCERIQQSERYMQAVNAVAAAYDMTLEELCSSSKFIGIEAQPNRIVTRDGEVIKHTSISLHYATSSCVFFVHDQTHKISKSWCYSGE